MSIFSKLFGLFNNNDQPIAHSILYNGSGVYSKAFAGSGFGIVFEDDGETSYLYATNEGHDQIYDTLHIYDQNDQKVLQTGQEVFIIWNPKLCKAGMYYDDQFHAVIDFKQRKACCRNGFPEANADWCTSSHEWDESSIKGLEPS